MAATDHQDNHLSPNHLIPATSISSSSKTQAPETGPSDNLNVAIQDAGQQMELYTPGEADQTTQKNEKVLTITGPAKTWKRIGTKTGRLQREPVTHTPIVIDNISGSKRASTEKVSCEDDIQVSLRDFSDLGNEVELDHNTNV
ncbi:nuclear distribution protein PAC1 [Striga asiatica]|uniref:Nuclear distribution protein PAC1 n=1 Tax=Striga asiatica TaxID=4170 RepID=A0A5A7QS99_STRAF|nr:nuclear distribution protein PAC1 [Striga asiatica]